MQDFYSVLTPAPLDGLRWIPPVQKKTLRLEGVEVSESRSVVSDSL